MKPAYQQTIESLAEELQTNIKTGLFHAHVQQRLKQYGLNALPEQPPVAWTTLFVTQFKNPLIYVLLIAATIIFFVDSPLDAFIISGVLLFNALVGTVQEGRAQTILESLKHYITTDAIVIRNGQKSIIQDTHLVPGDLIIIKEGEKIPADARIIQEDTLFIDESMLTGESRAVAKQVDPITKTVPIHDQKNMVFKGTYALSGQGVALVTHTGSKTAIGAIHHITETMQTDTPLKKSLDQLTHWILYAILGMCILLFAIGFFTQKPFTELLVILTALFICVIPEGLPVVFTLTLVSGAQRMALKHIIVRKLQAVEGLGRTSVFIIDKTGTLTRNEMVVKYAYTCNDDTLFTVTGEGYNPQGHIVREGQPITTLNNYPDLNLMAIAAALLSRTEITYQEKTKTFSIKGNATQAAAQIFSQKVGYTQEELLQTYTPIAYMPFDSQKRYQAGIYKTPEDGYVAFMCGSPAEALVPHAQPLTPANKEQLASLLKRGYRTVSYGFKKLTNFDEKTITSEQIPLFVEHGITILGFLPIEDAIRPEIKDMVTQVRAANIRVVMATGDHKDTALFVGKETGIYQPDDSIIEGTELENISENELNKLLPSTTIFARVTPEQKLNIVKSWQALHKKVAMTGDGVNDAPALVAADLGIAMGSTGTEVAKQAADIVLLNDSFAAIVDAIKEGRNIFYALRRVILYFFTTNMAEVLIVFFALIFNLPLPLLAAQILWLNLITDGFLDVALAMEPQEDDLLARRLQPDARLIDKKIVFSIVYLSLPMALGSLAIFMYYAPYDLVHARTMTLLTMAAFQWFNAWNCRSEQRSLLELSPFSNKWLILATTFVLFLQVFLVYNSWMQAIFRTVPVTLSQWALVATVASSIIVLDELRKRVWST